MADQERLILLNEVRYAERLCQRTARLYRRVQSAGTFLTVLGGSATLSSLSSQVPPWVAIAGAAAFTVFGALLLTVRPADKAASNEADCRRYAKVRAEAASASTSTEQLRVALQKARESDTAEVESLRAVAFNDVMQEIGQEREAIPLRPTQKLLAALA